MRRVVRALIACLSASAACVVPLSALQNAAPSDPVLFQRQGVPLSQLLSDPRVRGPVVIVQKDGPTGAGLVAPGLGGKQLEWMASICPIILVVRVDRVAPKLSPKEDWIVADVSAVIETVVRQPATESLATGDIISFVQDGGELDVAGRRVKAVLPYAGAYDAAGRYLLFTKRLPDGALNVYAPTNYLIDADGRLRSLAKKDRWPNSENGVTLSEAVRRIMASH